MEVNKKILIATGLYPPDIGGPATYVRMLEEKLPGQGIDCVVIAFTSVRHLPKVVRHFVYFMKLVREARAVDAVYAQDPVSVGVPALLASILFRKPFLIRLGGDYAWEQGQQRFGLTAMLDEYTADKNSAPWQVRVLAKVQSFVVRRAKKVVVPSNYMKSIVSTWSVRDAQLEVIYSALLPIVVEQSRDHLQKELEYHAPVLLSAARLVPWKGFEVLLEVVASLVTKIPNLKLVVAGDGPQKEFLEEKAKKLKIVDNVTFLGRLPKEDLGKVIKAADLFVLNTAYEGLSHQLLEVMDLETPIVTTSVGGNPELITHGVSGLTVSYNDATALQDAIECIINNEEFRISLIEQAKMRTHDFNQNTVVEKFVTLIETKIWQKK